MSPSRFRHTYSPVRPKRTRSPFRSPSPRRSARPYSPEVSTRAPERLSSPIRRISARLEVDMVNCLREQIIMDRELELLQ